MSARNKKLLKCTLGQNGSVCTWSRLLCKHMPNNNSRKPSKLQDTHITSK